MKANTIYLILGLFEALAVISYSTMFVFADTSRGFPYFSTILCFITLLCASLQIKKGLLERNKHVKKEKLELTPSLFIGLGALALLIVWTSISPTLRIITSNIQ